MLMAPNWKLYRYGRNPLLRTLAYIENERKAVLWTRGWTPRLQTYPGLEIPNPLTVEINRGEANIEVVLGDILGLTKLNFNSCIFADGNPITLKSADAIGEVLTAGPMKDVPPLPFRFYIQREFQSAQYNFDRAANLSGTPEGCFDAISEV